MPLPMQAKLLRTIQQKEIERIGAGYTSSIDVRIISATNSDLRSAIKKYKFREDLFYRLNVIPIHLPPLRERKEDIPLLANHFLDRHCRNFGKKIKGFKKNVIQLFMNYDWPGNIRELENLIERLVVLNKGDQIGPERVPAEIKGETGPGLDPEETKFYNAVKKFEAKFIARALEKTGGKKGQAAKMLGMHRNTLINLEKKLRLDRT